MRRNLRGVYGAAVPLWDKEAGLEQELSRAWIASPFLFYFQRKLTKVLNCYVGNAEDSSKTELLFAALKALKYLFRFIVQSRVLYLRWVHPCASSGKPTGVSSTKHH